MHLFLLLCDLQTHLCWSAWVWGGKDRSHLHSVLFIAAPAILGLPLDKELLKLTCTSWLPKKENQNTLLCENFHFLGNSGIWITSFCPVIEKKIATKPKPRWLWSPAVEAWLVFFREDCLSWRKAMFLSGFLHRPYRNSLHMWIACPRKDFYSDWHPQDLPRKRKMRPFSVSRMPFPDQKVDLSKVAPEK